MLNYQGGVLAEYVPYTCLTSKNLQKLAELKPKTLGIMHGSSFEGTVHVPWPNSTRHSNKSSGKRTRRGNPDK